MNRVKHVLQTIGLTALSICAGLPPFYVAADSPTEPVAAAWSASPQVTDKLYRQALYYYFAGDHDAALRQLAVNRERFSADTTKSQLFEAGLQVSAGLHSQATDTLVALGPQLASIAAGPGSESDHDDSRSATSPKELLLIASLQLAEQQLAQGKAHLARHTLQRIDSVLPAYVPQYQILSQRAYWPNPPQLPATMAIESSLDAGATPTTLPLAYVQLNQALLDIELQRYANAEDNLITLQARGLSAERGTFWQRLFAPSVITDFSQDGPLQQQAIVDYTRLLLAQLYIKQGRYLDAFDQLRGFPQQGPYSEPALFLYAVAADKTEQPDTALKLFRLLQERSPYSHLGWQAWLLVPQQLVSIGALEPALASYQEAEQHYLSLLTQLDQFEQDFAHHQNPLTFEGVAKAFSPASVKSLSQLSEGNSYVAPRSPWLSKAMQQPQLKADFRQLMELQQLTHTLQLAEQKSRWIDQTIALNKQRKDAVLQQQQTHSYRQQIAQLRQQTKTIGQKIRDGEQQQVGQPFADMAEQDWLNRIARSKETIVRLADVRDTGPYQQRLARVEGVLTWQLQTSLPQRLWSHKQQLTQLEHLLLQTEQQYRRFDDLSQSQHLLANVEQRQQRSFVKVQQLSGQIDHLKGKTSAKIHSRMSDFVARQRESLQHLLLTSRHKMAATLELLVQNNKPLSPMAETIGSTQVIQGDENGPF